MCGGELVPLFPIAVILVILPGSSGSPVPGWNSINGLASGCTPVNLSNYHGGLSMCMC